MLGEGVEAMEVDSILELERGHHQVRCSESVWVRVKEKVPCFQALTYVESVEHPGMQGDGPKDQLEGEMGHHVLHYLTERGNLGSARVLFPFPAAEAVPFDVVYIRQILPRCLRLCLDIGNGVVPDLCARMVQELR